MFRYFKKIDYKINETLNIYQEVARISIPFFKWLLLILSFLIIIISISIMISFFSNDSKQLSTNIIWINYTLPIIIYGIITPIISSIITIIIKFFLEIQISNIVLKYKFYKKKNGQYPHIYRELINIIKFIIFSKESISIPLIISMIYLPFDYIINLIFIGTTLLFFIGYKLSIYFNNNIYCNITSMDKCYINNEYFWIYNILVKYPNENQYIIKKRFSDFKKLHEKIVIMDSLPTADWFIVPTDNKQVNDRAIKLDGYIKKMANQKNILTNSVFNSFFSNNNNTHHDNLYIMEHSQFTNEINETNETNKIIINELNNIVSDEIYTINILYQINYYIALKKRFFGINSHFLYKFKFDKISNKFVLRLKIPLKNIYKIEKALISNTLYLKNKEIIIIHYKLNNTMYKIIITSITLDNTYNINDFLTKLKQQLSPNEYQLIKLQNYNLNIGYGITEKILHNNYVINTKHIITNKLLYLKSFVS